MPPQDVDQLIDALAEWCRAEHGRQKQFADIIGVSTSLLSHWIAKRKTPSWEDGLKIQEFLKQHQTRKPQHPP